MTTLAGEGDRRLLATRSAQSGVAVTPSDSTDLSPNPTLGLWIGGAGNINVDMEDGSTVLYSGLPAGSWMWLAVKRVRATSTTATLIVALY